METVDGLVTKYLQTEDELATLGKQIAASSKNLAVVFIDLSGSTELKYKVSTPRWLGYVVRFLETTATIAVRRGGQVVKRIGDELMITFDTAADAESFITEAIADPVLENFAFKVGVDWGETFGLSFGSAPMFDPYGPVVDRAARIAKVATRGTVIASKSFVVASTSNSYSGLGRIRLKGLPDSEELYLLRVGLREDAEAYLRRALEALNNKALPSRFRYRPRDFTIRDFEVSGGRRAGFPFLIRELLTLPRLPLKYLEFAGLTKTNLPAALEYLGHIVEWEAVFFSASDQAYDETFSALIYHGKTRTTVTVSLHPNMAEAIRLLSRDDKVIVRGVLVSASEHRIELDYADIQPAA
jgi:class 3 adenylate cyclase